MKGRISTSRHRRLASAALLGFAAAGAALVFVAGGAAGAAAAAATCASGSGHTVCVTVPASTLSGNTAVVVTNSPNNGSVVSTWIPSGQSGVQLINEFGPSPATNDYTFTWPTQKYLDASGTLRVVYSGVTVNVPVTLSNGNTTDFQHSPSDWASYLPGGWTGSQDPTVLAVGDGASNQVASNAVASQVAAANPPLFLYLGDVYETGTFTEMRNQYGVSELDVPNGGTIWGATADVTQPTIGNHEYPNKTAWTDYFHGRPLYTKFTFGGVLFLDLDNFQSMAVGSAEYNFVQSAITAPGVPPCVVAYGHVPAISGGTIKTSEQAMWALLANNGVDLLLVGHQHTMTEYKPMDANFNAGTSGAHLVQLINGAGGHGIGGALSDSRIAWSLGKTPGVLALTLNGARGGGTASSIGWTFENVQNSALRTGSVTCGNGSPQNQAPTVNAGSDQTVTFPNAASLSGTATDDGLPNPPGAVTTTWSKVSGPGTVTFGNASALSTTASFSATGTYVLQLLANDSALQSTDQLTVTVTSAQNQAPTVNAGSDQTVTFPNSASLSGTASDDGLPNPPGALTTTWSQVSGPGTVTFGNASALSTTASFSATGTYVLQLAANDSALQSSDQLTVTVTSSSQNLIGNPGFETDTSGWNVGGSDAGVTLTRASGGHSGGWSGLVANGGTGVASGCKLNDAPNWVKVSSSGTYTLTMWVRADTSGANFNVKLREYNGGTLVALTTATATLSTSWQQVTLTYVPQVPGVSTLDIVAMVSNAPVGTCFYADDLSLTLSP